MKKFLSGVAHVFTDKGGWLVYIGQVERRGGKAVKASVLLVIIIRCLPKNQTHNNSWKKLSKQRRTTQHVQLDLVFIAETVGQYTDKKRRNIILSFSNDFLIK